MRIPSPTPYTLLHSHLIDVAPQLPPPLQAIAPYCNCLAGAGGVATPSFAYALTPKKRKSL